MIELDIPPFFGFNQFYLDGQPIGSSLTPDAGSLPAGKLRFGKDTFDEALDGGGKQFYGLLDDVAIFKTALPVARIASLANAHHLSGTEQDLFAGLTFGYVPAGGLPSTLNHAVMHTPQAWTLMVSDNRDNAADAKLLPLALTNHRHLPLPDGEKWFVIQGFDDPAGSHKGYASFCLDLDLAGQPQSDSNGHPFYAVSPGTVDFVVDSNSSGGSANFISVKENNHEICDYLHLSKGTAAVALGGSVSYGQHLADIGDTGANVGAYHLHIAMTNLGEGKKNLAKNSLLFAAS